MSLAIPAPKRQSAAEILRSALLRKEVSYSIQRLKISEPLVPPKPKEFDSAYSA
jgi:hypothetical protein